MINTENLLAIIKPILYFAYHTNDILYYTKLQLLLFYYEKEYFEQCGQKVFNRNFIYDGYYIPRLEGLDELLEMLDLKQIIKFTENEYGKYIEPIIALEESEYTDRELIILRRILKKYDNLTATEIVENFFRPELKQGKIRTITITKTLVTF